MSALNDPAEPPDMTGQATDPAAAKKEEFLDSLANGLALLRLYAGGQPTLTVQEAAEKLEVTRAAARRLLLTLHKLGYLSQQGRDFAITPKVLDLGYAYFASMSLPRLARPAMQALAARIGHTCSLGVLDGEHVVFLAREEPPLILRLDLSVGSRLPAYAHSLGRLLLAALDDTALDAYLATANLRKLTPFTLTARGALRKAIQQTRVDGHCAVFNELVDGFGGLSMPIRDGAGKVVAGIGFSTVLGSSAPEDWIDRHLPALRDTVAAIEHLVAAKHT